jgi:oligopeptide transport system ATP-binding protein
VTVAALTAGSGAAPSAEPGLLLGIDDLTIEFKTAEGRFRAVDGLGLEIRRRRTLALVGESGCGKSVTSLAVMGLLPRPPAQVVAGRITFAGRDGQSRDLLRLGRKALRAIRGDDIAMVFQEPMTSLNPVHTVGAQIAEVVTIHRRSGRAEALDVAADMLERVGIPEPRRRLAAYPHELSGGMRQRVMIAMALVCRPSLLIADEPTTALDVTIQAQILDEMRLLQQQLDMGILFVTHDLGVVAEIADRVAVMYAGQLVESGPVRDLLRQPRHPYTRGLLNSVPRPGGDRRTPLRAIKGIVPDPRHPPGGCRFHPRCAFAEPGRCDRHEPPLEAVGPERQARCLRWRELALDEPR